VHQDWPNKAIVLDLYLSEEEAGDNSWYDQEE
jgi:hypothetical protein